MLFGGFSTRNVESGSAEPFDPELTAEGLAAGWTVQPKL
jgi:hypothetical protein